MRRRWPEEARQDGPAAAAGADAGPAPEAGCGAPAPAPPSTALRMSLLADAAAGAGAGHLRDVNIVFARDFADERRAANFFPARSCGWRRGRSGFGCGGRRRRRCWPGRGRRGLARLRARRGSGRSSRGCARAIRVNHGDHGLNRNRLAFVDLDFFQHAGRRATEFPRPLCRWKFQTAVRRARSCRRPSSATW